MRPLDEGMSSAAMSKENECFPTLAAAGWKQRFRPGKTLIVYHISPGMESYLPISPRPDATLSLQGEYKVGGPL